VATRPDVAAADGGGARRLVVIDYVVPIRCDACTPHAHADLAAYLGTIARDTHVIVSDTSPPDVAALHAARFGSVAQHVPVIRTSLNGKVDGVCAGVRHATADRVIVADDDVRYSPDGLRAVTSALDACDLVIPQNVFPRQELPWHARWDTARSLLNRALGTDYPGTLALRRATFEAAGGYDGDVLFENLELIRTIEAAGGVVDERPDLYVSRLPPTAHRFVEQRVRQAYDDFARPARLAAALATIPAITFAVTRRRWTALALAAFGTIGVAEAGRRRAAGISQFPASAAVLAPLWVLERGVTSWLAIGSRVIRGGCVYRGTVIQRAATTRRELRRRQRARRRATHRTAASSATVRTDTAERPRAAG
jgi:Glycosyl transferase family 2